MAGDTSSPALELLGPESERFHVAYQEYFKGKRQNLFKAMAEFKGVWDGLQLLNDIWTREFSDLEHLREQTHLLPKLIFSAAHGRFLTAIELGFSCCIGDAYSILRDGIEAVAHAHKIFKEPTAGAAWTNKHKGKAELAAYNKIFEEKKKENLFPEEHGLRKLHTYYIHFSELATHTSVTSVGKSFEDMSTEGKVRWGFHYFETNPQRLAGFLNTLLQVSAHMEEAFFGCFETRLNLDPQLLRMRDEFQQIRAQQTRYLWDTYKLGSATREEALETEAQGNCSVGRAGALEEGR
jgi:hypothetical protein